MNQTITTRTTIVIAASALALLAVTPVQYTLSSDQTEPREKSCANSETVTVINADAVVVITEDDAREIASHNDRVRELAREDSSPLTEAERNASVEYVWQPGVGLVRQS